MIKNCTFAYVFSESAVTITEVELTENGNRVVGKGVLQTGNQINRNGRLYRTKDLAGQIVAPRQKELLKTGNMLGEAGHPMTKDLIRQQTIDPKCVCVRYLDFWMDGDNVMGTFKGTNNDLGKAFDLDLREGVLPAFSYRALGTVEETAEGSVVTNLKMITYDYVIYPSHPTAYTQGLVNESAIANSSMKRSNLLNYVSEETMNGALTNVCTFSNEQVIEQLHKLQMQKESGAIDYIKDYSRRYQLLKEAYDITNAATVDLIGNGKIAITESGIGMIVMSMDDYISKEIYEYTKK